MRSTVLVSRIVRVIETDGAVGDGAALAEEYDRAVRQVNARLEEVHAAVEAKQLSDAVRIMEMEPRIIEEISTLMFRQLREWTMMCARCRWRTPVSLDKSLFDRIILLSDSSEIVEPFLRMYRKAMMTNNHALALQSLRRLSAVDKSQDWSASLAQTEELVLRDMVDEFRAAKDKGDTETMQKIAQEFGDSTWTGNAKVQGIVEIRAFLAEKEVSQRNAVGAEDIEILRKCAEGEWKRSLVFSILQSLDGIIEQGWRVPEKDAAIVDECRRRCAKEMEEEERESQWKDATDSLAAAVEARNAASIREALHSTIFQVRPPEEKLLNDAKAILADVAKAERRKRAVIAACIIAGVCALFAVSVVFVRSLLVDQRCEAEVTKLEALSKKSQAIERLTMELEGIKEADPEVYADERVRQFETVVSELRHEAFVRTNELAKLEAALRSLEATKWDGITEADVLPKFKRADELKTADDHEFAVRFNELWESFKKHLDDDFRLRHDMAEEEARRIRSSIENWNVVGEQVDADAAPFKEIASWRDLYGEREHELSREIDSLEKIVNDRIARDEQMRGDLAEFDKMFRFQKTSCDAADIIATRERLLDSYGEYRKVTALGGLDATGADIKGFLAKVKGAEMGGDGAISDSAFMSFLNTSVLSLKQIPSCFSLYGLWLPSEGGWKAAGTPKTYFAVTKGRPIISRVKSSRYVVDVEGIGDTEILDLRKPSSTKLKTLTLSAQVESEELQTSAEIKGIVGAAPGKSVVEFEKVLLNAIGKHLKAAKEKGFLKNETSDESARFMQGRYPAIRRIQMINLYFSWLRNDMKVMPQNSPLAKWVDKVEDLAKDVLIDNVPEDLTWLYLGEKRISDRNEKCAKLLYDMAKSDILKTYREYRDAQIKLGKVSRWNIECVGAYPLAGKKLALDAAPYYLLRRSGEDVVPVRVADDVVPLPGEPIYVVKAPGGKPIDVQSELEKVKESVPKDAWDAFAPRSPFVR